METAAKGVIRPKSSKSKTLAEGVGLSAFVKSAPIIDLTAVRTAAIHPANLQARIDRLTDKSAGPDGVWKWLGGRNVSNAYPQISFKDPSTGKRRTPTVARVLMEIKYGRRLDRKEYALHQRGVPKDDVNPAHIRLGSQQENMDDAKAEGRLRGKLSEAQVLKIDYLFKKKGVEIPAIACRFGVSNQTVTSIVKGKTHSDITGNVFVPRKTAGRPAKVKLITVEKASASQPEAVT